LAVLSTLLVVCRLRTTGAFGGGLASRVRLRRFGRLGGLASLGGFGRSLSGRVSGALRGASRGARLRLQSRAAAATTLHRGRVLKSQETWAVGNIIVGAGPVRMTLVE
jgi:hypothetical protein